MLKGLAHMDTLSKICNRCNTLKPLTEFYARSYSNGFLSECKQCMRLRGKSIQRGSYLMPRVATEESAINYLQARAIPALPGKALRFSHVDVVAFGCVKIEVKHSKYEFRRGKQKFTFNATPAQKKHGFRAHIVMLICDYGDRQTYHLFKASDPVFYMNGRVKTGFTFTPGNYKALKHGDNRVVLVQGMMDSAQDNVQLIYDTISQASLEIQNGTK